MNSIHKSLRKLLELGLTRSASARLQTITRTVKFKIDTRNHPELAAELNQHFDTCESFRKTVLDGLEKWWNEKPDDFTAALRCSAKNPYGKAKRPFGLLYTRFVTGQPLPAGLSRDAAFSLVDSTTGNMCSFVGGDHL